MVRCGPSPLPPPGAPSGPLPEIVPIDAEDHGNTLRVNRRSNSSNTTGVVRSHSMSDVHRLQGVCGLRSPPRDKQLQSSAVSRRPSGNTHPSSAEPGEPPLARRRVELGTDSSPNDVAMESISPPHGVTSVSTLLVPQRPRFSCPICPSKNWASWTPLSDHLERFHLAALGTCTVDTPDIFPQGYLRSIDRRICSSCLLLAPLAGRCRRCKGACESRRRSRTAAPPGDTPQTLDMFYQFIASPFGGLRVVPSVAQNAWCDQFAALLRLFTDDPSEWNALMLLIFPRVTLAVCGRGGRQLNRHPSSIVLERIRRWERGEIKNLVDEADALRRSTTTRSARRGRGSMSGNEPADQGFSDGARRAIRRAIQDGALSKAAKIALSDHCELMTDAEEPLRRLHPPGNPVVCSVDDTFVVDFEAEEVTRAIKSFPPGSSGGPSGLRASHLVCPDSSIHNRLVGALAKFASLFASGRLPPHCRVLCQARLIALPKKPSGVRPIAVGETLRRIAAKCLVARFQPEAVENLTPLQLGVGVPGAAEAVVHHYSHWRREVPADSDNAMLLIDFANAFNTLDRGSMIDAIKSRAPQFYNYAAFCYGCPTALLGDGFSLWSGRGTQQGDACGPLFFSVAVQNLVESAARHVPSSKWYMDDGSLLGPVSSLQQAFNLIAAEGPRLGLSLNVTKCVLWGPNASAWTRSGAFAAVPTRPWEQGISLLGVPIGSAPFVSDFITKKTHDLQISLDKLSSLHCAHSATLILRSCLGASKITYLLRVLNPPSGHVLAGSVSTLLKYTWSDICGVPLENAAWDLATLPVRLGGLGIVDPIDFAKFAALSSFLSAAFSAPVTGITLPFISTELISSLGEARDTAPAMANLLLDTLTPAFDLDAAARSRFSDKFSSQSEWSGEAYIRRAAILDSAASERLCTLRQLFCGANAGKWLTSLPKLGGFFDSHEWQLLLRWRLGLPVSPAGACPGCRSEMDVLGEHALSCASIGTYSRHNALRDFISRLMADAGLRSTLEVSLPDDSLRPADIFVPCGWGPRPTAFDVSVVHPLRLSVRSSSIAAGSAAHDRCHAKHAYYDQSCRSAGWDFVPCAVETTGAWCHAAQATINRLAKRIAVSSGTPVKQVVAEVWTEASAVVARSVGAMLARCSPCGGAGFSAGTCAPTSSFSTSTAGPLARHLSHTAAISRSSPSPTQLLLESQVPLPAPAVTECMMPATAPQSPSPCADHSAAPCYHGSRPDPQPGSPSTRRSALVMSLPSGEVHPLLVRSANDPTHSVTFPGMGRHEPPSDVMIIDDEGPAVATNPSMVAQTGVVPPRGTSLPPVATNASLGLRDPPGPVELLPCERYTPPTSGCRSVPLEEDT